MRQPIRLTLLIAAMSTSAPSASQEVAFRLGLIGPERDRVRAVMVVSSVPSNAIVRQAVFDATIIDAAGQSRRMTFDMLRDNAVVTSGQQKTETFRLSFQNAKSITSGGLRWSLEAAGAQSDNPNEVWSTAPAVIEGSVNIAPPPSFGFSCGQYGELAVGQQAVNKALGCGFVSTRWSADAASHVTWCLSAGAAAALAETKTRARLLGECAAR